jgi:RNA polymerase sigma factor (sigma-70 family)
VKRSRLAENERERVAEVFEEHRRYIEGVAVSQVGRDAAPDVVQEVGVIMCRSLNGLRDPGAIRAYLYRVTVNAARMIRRTNLRHDRTREALEVYERAEQAVAHPDEHIRDNERREAFREALEDLKPRDKRLICDDLDGRRILTSDSTRRMALSRARVRLRDLLRNDPRFKL